MRIAPRLPGLVLLALCATWISFIAGVALRIGTRPEGTPEGTAPRTLDLRWLRAR